MNTVSLHVGSTADIAHDQDLTTAYVGKPFYCCVEWTADPPDTQSFEYVYEEFIEGVGWGEISGIGEFAATSRHEHNMINLWQEGGHTIRVRMRRKGVGDTWHESNSCTVYIGKVNSVTAKNAACTNETVTFTVDTDPQGYYAGVVWKVGGDQVQIGGQTLQRSWSNTGTQTVTACLGDSCASKKIEIIDGLTVVPRKAYVLGGGTKDFQAWACVGGVAQNVTANSSFTTDKGSMNNNTLTASSSPSTSEGANWVRATRNGQTTDAAHDCDLTVIRINLLSPADDAEFHMGMSGPTMPVVELEGDTDPDLTGLEYRFEIGDAATGRALEYEDAPASGYAHPSIINSGWIDSATWEINFGSSIYGGHVTTVKVSVRKDDIEEVSGTISRDFYILGDALTSSVRNAYIDSLTSYDANIRTMAKAIAQWESGGTHFWDGGGIGTASHVRYPLREIGGGGYGVMQLTGSGFVNINTIWNWKENINVAMDYIQDCYNAGVAYLNTHPAGVDDVMRRLEGYNRYNGGLANRYWWWSDGPETNNGVAEGWTKFGYKNSGTQWAAYRDYNNDDVADPDGNPYNIPDGPSGPNVLANRAAKYADAVSALE